MPRQEIPQTERPVPVASTSDCGIRVQPLKESRSTRASAVGVIAGGSNHHHVLVLESWRLANARAHRPSGPWQCALKNLSVTDAGNTWLTNDEELIGRLIADRDLRVSSRTSEMPFKDTRYRRLRIARNR